MVAAFTQVTVMADAWPDDVDVSSESAIVINYETGAVLYEKKADKQQYPASITKIMTALVAIENSEMDEEVTFSTEAVYNTEGSSIARDVGEVMTMEECLYGMLLESANECAYAIGEHVAGSEDAFVDMMNEKAEELGCTNTHFNNTNGLPDEQHYTSARDMALISAAAYANETFRIICGTGYYEIAPTNKHDEITYLRNHHSMLYPLKTSEYLYDGCTGGKTGYTTVANSTLVTYAERDGMTLVCVVMNASSPNHYTDTANLFDYCFENFTLWNISENETDFTEPQESFFDSDANIFETDTAMLSLDEDAQIILPVNVDFSAAEKSVTYGTDSDAVATIEYTYDGVTVGSADLTISELEDDIFALPSDGTASADASASGDAADDSPIEIPLSKILMVLGIILIIAILVVVILFINKNFYILKHRFESGRNRDSMNAMSKREIRRRKAEERRARRRRRKW